MLIDNSAIRPRGASFSKASVLFFLGLTLWFLTPAVVAAQDLPVPGDGVVIPVEGDESARSPSRQRQTEQESAPERRAARLPEHISVVISEAGILADGYERRSVCVADNCAEAVIEVASGDVAYFDGEWMVGYMVTRNGEEVWHVNGMAERAAQHTARQQAREP